MSLPNAAILFADGPQEKETLWSPLLPLIDRPFLQHVIERIAGLGVREVAIATLGEQEPIEALLGDGSRWGITLRYHASPDPNRPYALLPALLRSFAEPSSSILLAHADSLPLSAPAEFKSGDTTAWSGWFWASPETLLTLPTAIMPPQIPSSGYLSAQTPRNLLDAQRSLLLGDGDGAALLRTGSKIEPGISMGRNVVLHPSAQIMAPVFIGENCRIGAGARIGPNVVLSADCVVDIGATVEESAVLPGTYIGEDLEIQEAFLDRNRLYSVRHATSLVVTDCFLLGDLHATLNAERVRGLLSQTATLIQLALFWPLLLLTLLYLRAVRSGPLLHCRTIVALPAAPPEDAPLPTASLLSFQPFGDDAPPTPEGLRHLLLVYLPGLLSAVRGAVRLVGVPPRSEAEVLALPSDWGALYRRAAAGLITEPFVLYGSNPSRDEAYTAEAYYSVASGIRHDVSLFVRYLVRVFTHRSRRSVVTSTSRPNSLRV